MQQAKDLIQTSYSGTGTIFTWILWGYGFSMWKPPQYASSDSTHLQKNGLPRSLVFCLYFNIMFRNDNSERTKVTDLHKLFVMKICTEESQIPKQWDVQIYFCDGALNGHFITNLPNSNKLI